MESGERKVKSKNFVLYLGLAVLVFMTSAFAQTDTTYTFETINYPGDTFTQLLGINNAGKIAGYHGADVNKGFTYLLSTKKFTAENFTNSAQTQVTGLNDQAKTVGFYISQSGTTAGFIYAGGIYTSIVYPGTPFNQLLSQNNKGQAAGYYSTKADGSGPDHAYIYDELGGVFELFNIPNSTSAQATGINDVGTVCGFTIDTHNVMHGWLQVLGTVTILNYPGATATAALGLNNTGLVVGSYNDKSGASHGFVYNTADKTWQSIDDPAGPGTTIVNGVNDAGDLVGFSGTSPINNGFLAQPVAP